MASIQYDFRDTQQAVLMKGSDVARIVQVDETGTAYTGTGTDFFGNDGGSIYNLPFKQATTLEIPGSSVEVVSEAAVPIGHSVSMGAPQIRFEFIGDHNKFGSLSTGTGKYTLENLILSGVSNIYWKLTYYELTSVKTTAALTTSTQYLKKVFWMGKFLPSLTKTFSAGNLKIIQATFLPEIKDSATDLGAHAGGKIYKNLYVNDVQALASETFESQTEATT